MKTPRSLSWDSPPATPCPATSAPRVGEPTTPREGENRLFPAWYLRAGQGGGRREEGVGWLAGSVLPRGSGLWLLRPGQGVRNSSPSHPGQPKLGGRPRRGQATPSPKRQEYAANMHTGGSFSPCSSLALSWAVAPRLSTAPAVLGRRKQTAVLIRTCGSVKSKHVLL